MTLWDCSGWTRITWQPSKVPYIVRTSSPLSGSAEHQAKGLSSTQSQILEIVLKLTLFLQVFQQGEGEEMPSPSTVYQLQIFFRWDQSMSSVEHMKLSYVEAIDPLRLLLSILTGSCSLGSQLEVFHITSYLIL